MTGPGVVVHSHPVPAEQDETAVAVAAVLAAGYTAAVTAAEVAALLAPWRVSLAAVDLALKVIEGPYRARPRTGASTGVAAEIVRAAGRSELAARAAYLVAASGRFQDALDTGTAPAVALTAERPNYLAHDRARRKRLDAAKAVGLAAAQHGPLLGWYRDPESNSETECRLAHGHNFRAFPGPVIGYPGAVHPHCRCVAGPPHAGAGSVDDALSGRLYLTPRSTRLAG